MNRDLDGVYFRVKRDDTWKNICFSNLTDEEKHEVLIGRDAEWIKSLCIILGNTIKQIGDELNIFGGYIDEDELVIHPDHYNKTDRKECWEEMEELFGPDAVAVFDVLNAYKYKYRAGEKEGNSEAQDKAKINNYMHHAANLIAITDADTNRMTLSRKVYKKMGGIIRND